MQFILFSSFAVLWGIFNGTQNTHAICYMKLQDHEAIHSKFSVKTIFKLCTQSKRFIMRGSRLKIFSDNVSKNLSRTLSQEVLKTVLQENER